MSGDFSNVIVVLGLPKGIDGTKQEKLRKILIGHLKVTGSTGNVIEPVHCELATAKNDANVIVTVGHGFAEYNSTVDVSRILTQKRRFAFDKNHNITLVRMSDVDRLMQTPADYVEPEDSVIIDRFGGARDRFDWILDSKGMDSFLIRDRVGASVSFVDLTQIDRMSNFWRKNTCPPSERQSFWSEWGSYLMTLYTDGFEVSAGRTLESLYTKKLAGVQCIKSSPGERFIATYRPETVEVWDAVRGALVHEFSGPFPPVLGAVSSWPYVKFSYDEKYAAVCPVKEKDDRVYRPLEIYTTSNWQQLLQKTPVGGNPSVIAQPADICGYEWSPRFNLFAYWVTESGNTPGSVTVVRPEEQGGVVAFHRVAQKQLFKLRSMNLHWSPDSPILVCSTVRGRREIVEETSLLGPRAVESAKKKTKFIAGLEILRLGGKKGVPLNVEALELDGEVIQVALATNSTRFAVVRSVSTSLVPECVVSIYDFVSCEDQREKVQLLATVVQPRPVVVSWSPAEGYFVMTVPPSVPGTPVEGKFIFGRLSEKRGKKAKNTTPGSKFTIDVLREVEHTNAACYEWSPSGRHLSTWVPSTISMNNGARIWDVLGEMVLKFDRDVLWCFQWRPRPPCLITKEQKKVVEKLIPERISQWRDQNGAQVDSAGALRREMVTAFKKWREWRDSKADFLALVRAEHAKMRGYDSGDEQEIVEEVIIEDLGPA